MCVVYRTIPTSNHNLWHAFRLDCLVVYRTIPTSNHNYWDGSQGGRRLYIVLFLHQTTTIKPNNEISKSCISYYSYIKPQLVRWLGEWPWVVYRTIPTSNHNFTTLILPPRSLYIVLFLHQTTTKKLKSSGLGSCISYYSYIKPQLYVLFLHPAFVVYRTIPTSNHNSLPYMSYNYLLYIVLFLHQTTTLGVFATDAVRLYIVLFLHQTTTLLVL